MKLVYLIFFVLTAHSLYAQQESLVLPAKKKTISGTIREKLNHLTSKTKSDTVNLEIKHSSDSLQQLATNKADSVDKAVEGKLDSLQLKITNKTDSLSQLNPIDNINAKIDSVGNKVTAVSNKLEQKITQPQDYVQSKLDSITTTINKPIDNINQKLSEANNKVQNGMGEKTEVIEKKLSTVEGDASKNVKDLTGKNVAIPGVEVGKLTDINGDVTIPTVNADLPKIQGVDIEVPEVEIDGLNIKNPEITDVNLPSNVNLPKVDKLNEIGNIDELKQKYDPSAELGQVDAKLAEVEKIETGVQQLKAGNTQELEEQVEAQVTQLEPIQGVSQEITKLTSEQAKYASAIKKYRDKKLLVEEIKRKSQNVVNDKLNQYSPAFKDAQADMSKLKKKYTDVKSIQDLPKRKPNVMRGKPFKERFIPGGSFQIYNQEKLSMDLSLHGSWRFTRRLSCSLAGVYRIGLSDQYEYIIKSLNVYGGRAYVDWTFKKGFYLHGELEVLAIQNIPAQPATQGPRTFEYNDHLISAVGGVGRQFNISRRVQGSILALYRFELDGYIPEYNKLNVRVGFNYLLSKKKRSILLTKSIE